MKILLATTDYPGFLSRFYCDRPGLEGRPYEEQARARAESLFGHADFYSRNLRVLGHEVWDVYPNNEAMQRAWARDRGVEADPPAAPPRGAFGRAARAAARRVRRFLGGNGPPGPRWLYQILGAQIAAYRPDVLFNFNLGLDARFFREQKGRARLLAAQYAAPWPPDTDLSPYDLFFSSLPHYVERARAAGVRGVRLNWAFEPLVLDRLGSRPKTRDAVFVGSLSPGHAGRSRFLAEAAAGRRIEVWGGGAPDAPGVESTGFPIRGEAFGIDMYRILAEARIALNHHIDAAGPYANNMRLFEATGVGTFLLTDAKDNLSEFFRPGEEVAVYRAPEECAAAVGYYLAHPEEREAIARAGQARTLRDHTFAVRMRELSDVLEKALVAAPARDRDG